MISHETYLRRAIALSLEKMLSGEGGPFGAVIVKDGKVIAEGWNRVTRANDPTAHAEMEAIRAACRKLGSFSLQGCVLYASCEPCPMCLAAAYWARVDEVHFAGGREDASAVGFDDGFLYKELALPLSARALPMHQGLGEEAQAAFKAWAEKRDKVEY